MFIKKAHEIKQPKSYELTRDVLKQMSCKIFTISNNNKIASLKKRLMYLRSNVKKFENQSLTN